MTKQETLQHKVLNEHQAIQMVNRWRLTGKKVAFTNGCFDILHKGHIKVLTEAAQTANKLIVGLNADASVRRLKGEERPLNNEQDRALLLAALQFVDAVVLFEQDTPEALIKLLKPDVLVKGGDYKMNEIVGADFIQDSGGEVVIVPIEEGYATTQLVNKIKKS